MTQRQRNVLTAQKSTSACQLFQCTWERIIKIVNVTFAGKPFPDPGYYKDIYEPIQVIGFQEFPWILIYVLFLGERPYKCGLCPKAFADKSNLRAHTQTHSSSKPFECRHCGKTFALKSYLYKHEEASCNTMKWYFWFDIMFIIQSLNDNTNWSF